MRLLAEENHLLFQPLHLQECLAQAHGGIGAISMKERALVQPCGTIGIPSQCMHTVVLHFYLKYIHVHSIHPITAAERLQHIVSRTCREIKKN